MWYYVCYGNHVVCDNNFLWQFCYHWNEHWPCWNVQHTIGNSSRRIWKTQRFVATRVCSCECGIETWCPLSSVAHARPVRGIAVDGLNMEVISASSDCTVKVYIINIQIFRNTCSILRILNVMEHWTTVELSINQSIDQSINWPINQSINQSINQ